MLSSTWNRKALKLMETPEKCFSYYLSEATLLQSLAKVFNTKPASCQEVFNPVTSYFVTPKLCFVWQQKIGAHVNDTEANLLASTRLRAPINVGSDPRVEAMIGVAGKPRQMEASTVVLISSEMMGHDRTIGPPTITASGASPRIKLAIPTPR